MHVHTCTHTQSAEEEETWESLTIEKEHWIRLIHHLEALTLLANVIGQKAMRVLPPAPFAVCAEEEEEGHSWEIDVGVLQLQLLSESMCVCVLSYVIW